MAGLEPATITLTGCRSTIELHPSLTLINGGEGGTRTHEAYAAGLQPAPFAARDTSPLVLLDGRPRWIRTTVPYGASLQPAAIDHSAIDPQSSKTNSYFGGNGGTCTHDEISLQDLQSCPFAARVTLPVFAAYQRNARESNSVSHFQALRISNPLHYRPARAPLIGRIVFTDTG